MSSKRDITKAASIVGSATLLSRIFGFLRDAAIASVFGASVYTDIFFVAFRIPNFFRRLLGEGAFSASLIPVLTDEIEKGSEARTKELVSKVFTFFGILFVILTILGIVFSRQLVVVLAPGFADIPEKLLLATSMTRWTFPFLFFIGLLAVSMGALNTVKHFLAPAISPVLFNIAIILSVLLLAPFFENPIYALAIGVVGGGFFQFVLQLPYLKRYKMLPSLDFNFSDPALRRVVFLLGPYTLGVAVYQINIFVTQRFASTLAEGSISYLFFANRLVELPLGVFGVAIATATLPALSGHASKEEWVPFKETFSFAVRTVTFISIPSMVGLILLGSPIISLLFQRGAFDQLAVNETVYALYFYSIGIWALAGTKITATAFYSMKDTKTPAFMAILSVFTNLVLCILLIGPLRHGGLALAISIAAIVNFVGLLVALRLKLGNMGGREILKSLKKIVLASVIMGIAVYSVNALCAQYSGNILGKALSLTASLVAGAAIYFFLAYLLKIDELKYVMSIILRKSRHGK